MPYYAIGFVVQSSPYPVVKDIITAVKADNAVEAIREVKLPETIPAELIDKSIFAAKIDESCYREIKAILRAEGFKFNLGSN